MKHLILFAFLVTQTIGIIALFDSFVLYRKSKDRIINCTGYSIHLFCNVSFRKIKNTVLLLISLFFFILSNFSFRIDSINRIIVYNKLIYLLSFLIIILIYAVITAQINRKKLSGFEERNISDFTMILTVIFLPFFVFSFKNIFITDVFPLNADYSSMLPFSVFYLILSCLFIYYSNARYRKVLKVNIGNPYFPEESFYEDFKISLREKEIIIFILKGFDNKEIAVKLSISVNTVKVHVANIFKKLNVKSRFELIKFTRNTADNTG